MEVNTDISEENCIKINFSETSNFKEKDMSLSFFFTKKPFEIVSDENIVSLLNKAKKSCKLGFSISNIKNIIPTTSFINKKDFSSFIGVLFLDKEAKDDSTKRKGILIGISNEGSNYICGLWPYRYYLEIDGNFQEVIDKILDFSNNPSKISELLIVTKK